jgi:hypothetical protein
VVPKVTMVLSSSLFFDFQEFIMDYILRLSSAFDTSVFLAGRRVL